MVRLQIWIPFPEKKVVVFCCFVVFVVFLVVDVERCGRAPL